MMQQAKEDEDKELSFQEQMDRMPLLMVRPHAICRGFVIPRF
jgi:hypothetical protein